MIKLIATDMDGCLLHNDKSLPTRTFDVINKCFKKGIKFCIASGRSYASLETIFKPVIDKIAIVCENGAYVKDNENVIYASSLDLSIIHKVIDEVSKLENTDLMLCSSLKTYALKDSKNNKKNIEEMGLYYDDIIFVDDLKKVKDDIFKICICNTLGSEKNVYPHLKHFDDTVEVIVSAYAWVDIINLNNNKGNGLAKLQAKYDIKQIETICFGDYLNDLEMFINNPLSIAVDNAHPIIKKHAHKVIGSNEEEAVIDEIIKIID